MCAERGSGGGRLRAGGSTAQDRRVEGGGAGDLGQRLEFPREDFWGLNTADTGDGGLLQRGTIQPSCALVRDRLGSLEKSRESHTSPFRQKDHKT